MRRWNGWGDEAVVYPLPPRAIRSLEKWVGAGTPPRDASLQQVLAKIPLARVPAHPLVSTDPLERLRHARGQSLPDWVALRSGHVVAFPDGVAYPTSAGEVRDILRFASEIGATVIPYGGGTSVVGHVNAVPQAIPTLSVDLARMNGLLHFDEASGLATFGAGITGPDLEAFLRARGHTLGHYPQSFEYSTLGGWIATRGSGQQSLLYGRIERLFAGGRLEAPAGTLVLQAFPASAAGPDLREVVLGSEGRIGILTEATVRVTPLPEREEFLGVFFADFPAGQEAVREIVQARLPLSMLRLSTARETVTTLVLAGHEALIDTLERLLALRGVGEDKCMLILGLTGRRALVAMARRESLGIARKHGGVLVGRTFGRQWYKSRFRTPYLRNTLWEMGYAIDTLETATDWANVPRTVKAVEDALRGALAEVDERVHVFTHLSHLYPYGSSTYTTFLFRLAPDPDETLQRWQRMKAAASKAIVDHGGTISHQHGVGLDHLPYLAAEKGPLGIEAIRDVCRLFDPAGTMNPGKMVP